MPNNVRWNHKFPMRGNFSGLLTTAGKLLFGGDPSGNVMAMDPANGKILWHASVGASMANVPMTYELDGHQYVVFGAGDMLYAFTLSQGA